MPNLSKTTSGLQDWLQNQVDHSMAGTQLPTISQISRSTGFSQSTIKKVMKEFVQKGEIVTIRGKGSFVPPLSANIEPAKPDPQSWKQILEQIESRIAEGVLRSGRPLPLIKNLCLEYHVTPSTVIKAYRKLIESGLVTKIGRTYWVGHPKTMRPNHHPKEMLFLYNKDSDLDVAFHDSFMAECYQSMQRELVENNYVFRFFPLQYLKKFDLGSSKIYGMILHHQNHETYEFIHQDLEKILKKSGDDSHRIRVMIDWARGCYRQAHKNVIPMVRGHFSTSSANLLASYINNRSFNRITFYVDLKDTIWKASWMASLEKIHMELHSIGIKAELQMVLRYDKNDINKKSGSVKKSVQDYLTVHTKNWRKKSQDPEAFFIENSKLCTDFETAFQENQTSDLWIFARDKDAVSGLQWAQKSGLKVPLNLNIMGLEDRPRFYPFGISTCVPDWAGTGYLMAHSIIGDFPVSTTTRGFLKTSAAMMHRLTTETG